MSTRLKPASPVERYLTGQGIPIYRISVQAFTDFYAWVYLVATAEHVTLFDTGSSYPANLHDLLAGFDLLRRDFGVSLGPADIDTIVITHGHIDHYGGLNGILPHAPQARVAVHELDLRVLVNHDERVLVVSKRLNNYLRQAGVSDERRAKLLEMQLASKTYFKSVAVHDILHDGSVLPGGLQVIHVPGHCPGQVVVRIDDVLLSTDQVLPDTTPHQAPESIVNYTGLGHYLESLAKVKALPGIRLALGGHEGPIEDLYARVEAIEQMHHYRLQRILTICAGSGETGLTISDISHQLYSRLSGYNVLLGLEETGAHVEYLYQRGLLAVTNLDELEREENPAIRYRTL